MHWGADESRLERRIHTVFLKGNAYLIRDNEEVYADTIQFNQETQFVKARGRVRYQYGEYFVRADAIDLDLKHKTGVIINGNLTNGTFALRGSRMEQIGEDRFLVKDYDYTTCLDCPNSWEIAGSEVDFTLENYAFIKDFMFKVKDASLIWFPYLIMPIKSKRQSGLLFPRFGVSQSFGAYFIQPTFWAINDWSDMTVGLGYLSKAGARLEWEGRYAITNRSAGLFNFFMTKDDQVPRTNFRYAAKAELTQELPYEIEGKLRFYEVSDSRYPIQFFEDVPGRYEPALISELFFYRNSPKVSTVVSAKRIRSLLAFEGDTFQAVTNNDPGTVQEIPKLLVTSNDQFLYNSGIAAGLEARFNRFDRGLGPFDYIDRNSSVQCVPGTTNCDPIVREAQRFTFIPNLYKSFKPFPWLSVTPNIQYRSYIYNFNNAVAEGNTRYPNLARGYLLAQADMSMQFERMFATDDPAVAYKHTIRPTLRYSLIPTVQSSDDSHPFLDYGAREGKLGRYFDNNDIVPINTSQNLDTYFVPLGNSLTYGLVTQLFKRTQDERGEFSVSKRLEASVTQTFDIQEAQRAASDPSPKQPRAILSPLFANLQYTGDVFTSWIDYTYYAYLNAYPNPASMIQSPHRLSLGTTWTFDKAIHDGVMQFERSLSAVYSFSKLTYRLSNLRAYLNFSINDYIMPRTMVNFDLVTTAPKSLLSWSQTVLFQSPSRCWRFEVGAAQSIDQNKQGFDLIFNFGLNLTGGTFGSL